MSGSLVLLHLAGAVSLLLWATHMVRSGVEAAYGEVLRSSLGARLKNPLVAIPTGVALALCFQSATAVTLLVGSFTGAGIVSGVAGLITVLGADLGSALMVRLLSFDLSALTPAALLCGALVFFLAERPDWREFGRIVIGAGLLLLSLRLIADSTAPLRDSEMLPLIVGYLAGDAIIAFLFGVLATWLLHSSIAFVLLIAAFAAEGLMPATLGVVLVLGANLGSGLTAAALSRSLPVMSRVVPLSNLVLRGLGAVGALAAVTWLAPPLDILGETAPERIVHAHLAFNAAMLVAGLALARPVHGLIEGMLARAAPPSPVSLDPNDAGTLDPGALGNPSRALANVTRAVVGLCDMIELMLEAIMEVYEAPDDSRIEALVALDERVHRRHAAIKLYLARITIRGMTDEEERRAEELLDACVRLEQVSDIIARSMLALVRKKRDRRLFFTTQGWRELVDLHVLVLANARLAFNVLLLRDPATALELVREKDRLRDLERETGRRHFERLREGTTKSIETSSLHLDTVRDLKQINSLLASLAYPILEEHDLLLGSRLRTEDE